MGNHPAPLLLLRQRLARDEAGFTLVELLSALLVVSIGVIALITTFDTSRNLVTFSEAKETAVNLAERELEALQAIPFDKLELKAAPEACDPSPCASANQLPYYLGPSGWYRWDQDPTPSESSPAPRCAGAPTPSPITNCERLVIQSPLAAQQNPVAVTNEVTEHTTPTRSGDTRLSLEMQRFVTWADDDCARAQPGVPSATCTGAQDHKRITVAVRIVTVQGQRRLERGPKEPFLLSTIVRRPRRVP